MNSLTVPDELERETKTSRYGIQYTLGIYLDTKLSESLSLLIDLSLFEYIAEYQFIKRTTATPLNPNLDQVLRTNREVTFLNHLHIGVSYRL